MPTKIEPAVLSPDRKLLGIGVAATVLAYAIKTAGGVAPHRIPRAHVMIHFGVHGARPASDHHVAPLDVDPHAIPLIVESPGATPAEPVIQFGRCG